MDSPLNAFGIFSAERDNSGGPLDFIADGYESEMGYFLRQGDVYVQTLASSTTPLVMKLAWEYTLRLTNFLPADDTGMEGRSYLPDEGQVPGSLTYINDNAYGQSALNAVFEARYSVNGVELTYFVKNCADKSEAASVWGSVKSFYEKYGSGLESFSVGPAKGFAADMFDQWAAIFANGSIVAGVMNAPTREAAMAYVEARLAEAESEESLNDYNF